MEGVLEYKQLSGSVSDVDSKSRTVSGMLAHFESKDFDDDITRPGAFKKSIAERGPQGNNSIYFLNFHNFDQPHNTFKTLQETKDGLYFEAVMPNTSYSNDTLELYDKGIIKQHSYGHIVQRKSYTGKIRNIEETYLVEGSNVTLGSNPNTPFLGFKSLSLKDSEDMISKVMWMIRNGNLTDKTFHQLEIALKQLQRDSFLLGQQTPINELPDDKSTVLDNTPTAPNLINSLINVLQN